MLIQVNRLEGIELDWAVFKSITKGELHQSEPSAGGVRLSLGMLRTEQSDGNCLSSYDRMSKEWSPSTIWSQGGPLLERDNISLGHRLGLWIASTPTSIVYGDSALLAAMRCFVSNRLGPVVDDELFDILIDKQS